MKVVIPNFSAPDSFVENVAFTLRAMGHEVLTRPPYSNDWVNSRFNRVRRQVMQHYYPNRFTAAEKWLLKAVTEFHPELVLTLTQPISEEVLSETRRSGVANRVVWWGDTPANMRDRGVLSGEWDFIYLKDPHGVSKFRRLGLNASLLHEAMNPQWHRPLASNANNSIVVAGTFYGYRDALVRRLLDAKVELSCFGAKPPRWCDSRITASHSGKFVVREEKSKVFGEGLACLNSTSLSEGNSMNCRAFEIAGAGGLQLLEDREIVTECFEPQKELLIFRSVDDLLELILKAKRERSWVAQIRQAGAKRAAAEHTYRHRLTHILDRLQ